MGRGEYAGQTFTAEFTNEDAKLWGSGGIRVNMVNIFHCPRASVFLEDTILGGAENIHHIHHIHLFTRQARRRVRSRLQPPAPVHALLLGVPLHE